MRGAKVRLVSERLLPIAAKNRCILKAFGAFWCINGNLPMKGNNRPRSLYLGLVKGNGQDRIRTCEEVSQRIKDPQIRFGTKRNRVPGNGQPFEFGGDHSVVSRGRGKSFSR